eukprot:13939597-Alexandrium_andersonii.AAC.1
MGFPTASISQRGGGLNTRASLRGKRAALAKSHLPGLEFKVVGVPPGFRARSQRRRASRSASVSKL